MIQDLNYEKLLQTSQRINWQVDDIIGGEKRLDFSKPFLPESFASTGALGFLGPQEQRILNQIRGYGYLSMFELIERCVLPYIDEHTPSTPAQDSFRTPALTQFAAEEAKHIELFVRFRQEFLDGFDVEPAFIGPAEDIGAAVRNHSALGVAMFVLAVEWATQEHYVASVRGDRSIDPQFASLLKHHWMEEAQHAKLDTLMFYELAEAGGADAVRQAVADFLDIGGFVDAGLKQQTEFDLAAFEEVTGRNLSADQRAEFAAVQHQAMRWTFLGSAMKNASFREALGNVSEDALAQIDAVAPVFC